jgi:hypothetical protein
MEEYMREAHGNWLALEFGEMFAADLSKKYGVKGMLTDGRVINICCFHVLSF